MLRYTFGILVAFVGGVAGPAAADAVGLDGLAAYGFFLAGVVIFVPVAAVLVMGAKTRAGVTSR